MQILLQIELWSHMPILMNLSQQESDDRENAHDFDERETFLNVFTARQLGGDKARMVRLRDFHTRRSVRLLDLGLMSRTAFRRSS